MAWNTGQTQKAVVGEMRLTFPGNTIMPIMSHQNIFFENPQDVAVWQFNSEFYCIIDHDDEVGCAGILFYNSAKTLCIALGDSEVQKFEVLLNMFRDELSSHDEIQTEMLRMLVGNLIIKLTRLAKVQYFDLNDDASNYTVVREFNYLVERHYRKHHTVQFYADLLAKSSKTLSNMFGLYSDKSPLQVIHYRIMWEAKRLMHYTNKSIKEIAYELGFEDAAHFSRFFKKLAGENPTAFRTSVIENQ
ncbi:MAG: helix-turn-helix domain-containing protein [Bacteroidota bacterium]